MKSTYLIAAVVGIGSLSIGCGSGPGSNTNTGRTNAANIIVDTANSNFTNGTANQPANGIPTTGQLSNIDVNAVPTGNVDMENRARRVEVQQTGPSQPPPLRPAPENSTVAITMDKSGDFIETRIFTGNQYLSKVERTSNGPKQTIKVFLKNGRVVQVPAERVSSINTITIASLLDLAGVKVSAPPAAKPGKTDEVMKKPGH